METFPDVRQFPPVQEFKPQFIPEEQLPPLKPFVQLVPQLFPLSVVYPQLFPGRKPVWQERDAAKDAKGIASVIMAETARAVIICFFMVKPPVM